MAWAFGKLLSVKTMLSVDSKLGDLIQEQLLPIAQLLDDRMAFSLVVDLTLTLAGLYSFVDIIILRRLAVNIFVVVIFLLAKEAVLFEILCSIVAIPFMLLELARIIMFSQLFLDNIAMIKNTNVNISKNILFVKH